MCVRTVREDARPLITALMGAPRLAGIALSRARLMRSAKPTEITCIRGACATATAQLRAYNRSLGNMRVIPPACSENWERPRHFFFFFELPFQNTFSEYTGFTRLGALFIASSFKMDIEDTADKGYVKTNIQNFPRSPLG